MSLGFSPTKNKKNKKNKPETIISKYFKVNNNTHNIVKDIFREYWNNDYINREWNISKDQLLNPTYGELTIEKNPKFYWRSDKYDSHRVHYYGELLVALHDRLL